MQAARRLNRIPEYYFSQKLREVAKLIKQGEPIINLGIGSPDLQPPDAVIQSLSKAVLEGKNSYQAYRGIPEFREAIAAFYRKHFQVSLQAENEILPLMGSKEGIMHISMAFLNPGDRVLIPNPGYATYTSVTKLLGATPVFYDLYPENNWLPKPEDLRKYDLSDIKIMWLNYPHMPTGASAGKSTFKELVDLALQHDILVVNDNPYSFILHDNPTSILAVPGAEKVALELHSLSKSFNMAGWRIGILAGNARFIDAVHKVKSHTDSGMYYALQKAAITALKSPASWFETQNKIYKKRRELLWQIAEKLGWSYEKKRSGLFVWAKLPEGENAPEVSEQLLRDKKVFITPGSIFGSRGEGYMRLSLCVDEKQLHELIARI